MPLFYFWSAVEFLRHSFYFFALPVGAGQIRDQSNDDVGVRIEDQLGVPPNGSTGVLVNLFARLGFWLCPSRCRSQFLRPNWSSGK